MRKILWFMLIAFVLFLSSAAAQDRPAFTEKLRIGRGAVLDAEWHPNGQLILVDTLTGAWLYDANLNDVMRLPDARLGTFSPDGRLIAGIGRHNALTLWETAPPFSEIHRTLGHNRAVSALEWRPDGTRLASLDRDGLLLVWDVATQAILHRLQMDGANEIAWSRGGSYLAALDSNTGAVRAWDAAGDTVLDQPWNGAPFGATFAWQDDSRLLRVIGDEIAVTDVWDIKTGEAVAHPKGGTASEMEYSPDGSYLAVANIAIGGVQDASTGETTIQVAIPERHQTVVTQWSPDGRRVAFGTWSPSVTDTGRVYVADVASGDVLKPDSVTGRSVKGLYWSRDSEQLLAVDNQNELYVLGIGSGVYRKQRSIQHTEIGGTAAWSSDSRLIAVSDTNFGSRLWDARTGQQRIARMNIGQAATRIEWQPGGTLVATAGGDGWQSANNNVFVWDGSQATASPIETVVIIPHTTLVAGIAWSPDGQTLASIERERYVRLWSPETQQLQFVDLWAVRLAPYIDYTQRTASIQWSPDGSILSYPYHSSGNGGGVNLIDAGSGRMIEGGSPNYKSDWAWTPDNELRWANWGSYGCGGAPQPVYDITLGVGYGDKINQPGEERLPKLTGLTEEVANGIFSPDASRLIGFDVGNHAIVWDAQTRAALWQTDDVTNAVWSPDGTLIALYDTYSQLRIVDAGSGSVVYTLDISHTTNVVWSPDSQQFALLDQGVMFIYEKTS